MHRKQGKVWGHTSRVFEKNNVEIDHIKTNAGGYCSVHCHVHKFNMFLVISGTLKIRIWKDYGLIDETVLTAGQSCEVEPGQDHQFVCLEDCEAIEVYWTQISTCDIVRKKRGGVKGVRRELDKLGSVNAISTASRSAKSTVHKPRLKK